MSTITGTASREALNALTEFEDTFGPMAGIQAKRTIAVIQHKIEPLREKLARAPERIEALEAASRVGAELAGAVRSLLPLCFERSAPNPDRIQAVVARLTELDELLNRVAEEAPLAPPEREVTGVPGLLTGPTRSTTRPPGVEHTRGLFGPRRRHASTPLPGGRGALSDAHHERRTLTPSAPITEFLPGFIPSSSDDRLGPNAADAPAEVTLSFPQFEGAQPVASLGNVTLPFGVEAVQAAQDSEAPRRSTTRNFTISGLQGIDRPSLLEMVEASLVELETVAGTDDPILCSHLDALESRRNNGDKVPSGEMAILLTDFVRIVSGPAAASVRNVEVVEQALDSALGALGAMARHRLDLARDRDS